MKNIPIRMDFNDHCQIWEAFVAFDLDKNKFVGAAEIRHVLINIGEQVNKNTAWLQTFR